MHLFRSSTPYSASGLLHCLSSRSPSFYIAFQPHSHFFSFSSSAANNPSGLRRSASSEDSNESGEGRISYGNRSNSTLVRPSLLASPSPDDARKPTIRPIGRLDISDETTTYIPPVRKNGRRYSGRDKDYGSGSSHGRGGDISRSWRPDGNNGGPKTRQKSLERRRIGSVPQSMSSPSPHRVFPPTSEAAVMRATRCRNRT